MMPGYDGKGPVGLGHDAGGGFGPCRAGQGRPGWFERSHGCGVGRRFGRGYHRMRQAGPDSLYGSTAVSPEKDFLREQKEMLKTKLEQVEARIEELEQQ